MGERAMSSWQEQLKQWLESLPLNAAEEGRCMEAGEGGGRQLGNRTNLTWTCAARPSVGGRMPGYDWAFDSRTRKHLGWSKDSELCRVHSGGRTSPEFPLCWEAARILAEAGCTLNQSYSGLRWLLTVPDGESPDALLARAHQVQGSKLPTVTPGAPFRFPGDVGSGPTARRKWKE